MDNRDEDFEFLPGQRSSDEEDEEDEVLSLSDEEIAARTTAAQARIQELERQAEKRRRLSALQSLEARQAELQDELQQPEPRSSSQQPPAAQPPTHGTTLPEPRQPLIVICLC